MLIAIFKLKLSLERKDLLFLEEDLGRRQTLGERRNVIESGASGQSIRWAQAGARLASSRLYRLPKNSSDEWATVVLLLLVLSQTTSHTK